MILLFMKLIILLNAGISNSTNLYFFSFFWFEIIPGGIRIIF